MRSPFVRERRLLPTCISLEQRVRRVARTLDARARCSRRSRRNRSADGHRNHGAGGGYAGATRMACSFSTGLPSSSSRNGRHSRRSLVVFFEAGDVGATFHRERRGVERRRKRRSPTNPKKSVPEVPNAGEDHGDAGVVGGFDDVFVLLAAAGLGDGGDAGLGGELRGRRGRGRRRRRRARCRLARSAAFSQATWTAVTRAVWPPPMPSVS